MAGVFVGAKADNGERSAMKVIMTDNNLGSVCRDLLGLVAPFADGFDGGLDGLCPAVHRKNLVRLR